MSDQKQDDGFGSPLGWSLVVTGALLVGFILVWLASPGVKIVGRAQIFGDVVGTVVSTFALVLLIFTVMQQQRAIRLQREDLALNREELKATRKELADAAQAQQRQVDIAQMAARLNATASLLDSASQEMLNLGPTPEGQERKEKKRQAAFDRVEVLRNELRTMRDELAGAVEISGIATSPPPQASGEFATDGSNPDDAEE